MSSDDMKIGIDPSDALKGAKDFDKAISSMVKSADRLQGEAGAKVDALFAKLSKLSNVASVSNSKVNAISNLSEAMNKLGSARGPSRSAVDNLSKLINVLGKVSNAGDFTRVGKSLANMSGFRGPSASAVTQTENLIKVLQRLSNTKGFRTDMLSSAAAIRQLNEALATLPTKADTATNALRRTGSGARSARNDFVHLRTEALSMSSALLRTREFMGGFAAIGGIGSIFGEIDTIQKSSAALTGVTGSLASSAQEMNYLKGVAGDLKIYVGDLSSNYAQFRASSQTTNLSLQQTQTIFRQVAQASRVFGLSNDDVSGTFRAMTQMMGKGAVQMEELRQQLGDRLPIAMQAAARGLGVTTAELFHMVKNKEITGKKMEEFMVGFGRELESMTKGGVASSLTTVSAMLAQLHNSFNDFAVGMGQSGLNETFANVTNGLSGIVSQGSPVRSTLEATASGLAFLSRNSDGLAFALSVLGLAMGVKFVTDVTSSVNALITQSVAMGLSRGQIDMNTLSTGRLSAAKAFLATAEGAATIGMEAEAAAALSGTLVLEGATVATTGMTAATAELNAVMMRNPTMWLIGGLILLGTVLFTLKQNSTGASQAQDALNKSMKLAADQAFASVSSISALTEEYKNLGIEARKAAAAQILSKNQTMAQDLTLEAAANAKQANESYQKTSGYQSGSSISRFGYMPSKASDSNDPNALLSQFHLLESSYKSGHANTTDLQRAKATALDGKGTLLETQLREAYNRSANDKRWNDKQREELAKIMDGVSTANNKFRGMAQGAVRVNVLNGGDGGDVAKVLGIPNTPTPVDYGNLGNEPKSRKDKKGHQPEALQALAGTPAEIITKSADYMKNSKAMEAFTTKGVLSSQQFSRELENQVKISDKAKSAWDRYQQSIPKKSRQSWDSVKEGNNVVAKSIMEAATASVSLADKLDSINRVGQSIQSVDPTYGTLSGVRESLIDISRFDENEFDKLFPESMLTRGEAMLRILDSAFKDISSLNTGEQLSRSWDDATTSLHAYIAESRKLHPNESVKGRVNREAVLSTKQNLDSIGKNAGTIGPIGSAAKAFADFNASLESLNVLSQNYGLTAEQTSEQVYTLSRSYNSAVREAIANTAEGRRLTSTMNDMASMASEAASALDKLYGGRTFSNQIENMVEMRKAVEEFSITAEATIAASRYTASSFTKSLLEAAKAATSASTTPTSIGSETVEVRGERSKDTPITEMLGLSSSQRGMVALKAEMEVAGRMSAISFNQAFRQASDSFDLMSSLTANFDNGLTAQFRNLSDLKQTLLLQVADDQSIQVLTDKVNAIRRMSGQTVELTTGQVLSAANAQIQQVNASLADTATQMAKVRLESSKIGQVLSDGISDLGKVLDNYMETGKLDTEDLFKTLRTGIRRAVIIDPLLDIIRKGASSALGGLGDAIAKSGNGPIQTALGKLLGTGRSSENKDVMTVMSGLSTTMMQSTSQYASAVAQFDQSVKVLATNLQGAITTGQATQGGTGIAPQVTSLGSPIIGPTAANAADATKSTNGTPLVAMDKENGQILQQAGTGLQNVGQLFLSSVIPSQYRGAANLLLSALMSLNAGRMQGMSATALSKSAQQLSKAASALGSSTNSSTGGTGGGTSLWKTIANIGLQTVEMPPVFHKGGIVGEDGVRRRLNNGKLTGSENLIIAKNGEEVLTQNDPRHADNYTGMPLYQKQVVKNSSAGDTSYTVATSNTFHVTTNGNSEISQEDLAKIADQIGKSVDNKIRKTVSRMGAARSMNMRG